jgi:hypothetical protein
MVERLNKTKDRSFFTLEDIFEAEDIVRNLMIEIFRFYLTQRI